MILSLAIFDLDGTVLDNEDVYGKAFSIVLKKLGAKVNEKRPHLRGIGVEENWPKLLQKYNIKTEKSINELAMETQREYLKFLNEVNVSDGFEEFASELKESGVFLALATSNSWSVVEALFDIMPLDKYFDVVTTGEETKVKKPDPEIFLITADKMGVSPENCIVFEDSKPGLRAAHDAGMKTVGIKGNGEEKLADADLVIRSFGDLTPSLISKI